VNTGFSGAAMRHNQSVSRNYSSKNDKDDANDHRINSKFDYWLSRRFYLLVPSVEYYKDPFQNLAGRVAAGGGLSYCRICFSPLIISTRIIQSVRCVQKIFVRFPFLDPLRAQ